MKRTSQAVRPKAPKARTPSSKMMPVGQKMMPASKSTRAKTGLVNQFKPRQSAGAGQ